MCGMISQRLTASILGPPETVSEEVWLSPVKLLQCLHDVVDEKHGVIVAVEDPFVVVDAWHPQNRRSVACQGCFMDLCWCCQCCEMLRIREVRTGGQDAPILLLATNGATAARRSPFRGPTTRDECVSSSKTPHLSRCTCTLSCKCSAGWSSPNPSATNTRKKMSARNSPTCPALDASYTHLFVRT